MNDNTGEILAELLKESLRELEDKRETVDSLQNELVRKDKLLDGLRGDNHSLKADVKQLEAEKDGALN